MNYTVKNNPPCQLPSCNNLKSLRGEGYSPSPGSNSDPKFMCFCERCVERTNRCCTVERSCFLSSLWTFFWATIIYYDCSSKLLCYYGSSETVYPGEGHSAYTHSATAIYPAVTVSHSVHCFTLVCWTESCRGNFHTFFYLSEPVSKVRKQGELPAGVEGQSVCRNTGLREELGISEGTCVSKGGSPKWRTAESSPMLGRTGRRQNACSGSSHL